MIGEVFLRDPAGRTFAAGELATLLEPARDGFPYVVAKLRNGVEATVPRGWVFPAVDLRVVFEEAS